MVYGSNSLDMALTSLVIIVYMKTWAVPMHFKIKFWTIVRWTLRNESASYSNLSFLLDKSMGLQNLKAIYYAVWMLG